MSAHSWMDRALASESSAATLRQTIHAQRLANERMVREVMDAKDEAATLRAERDVETVRAEAWRAKAEAAERVVFAARVVVDTTFGTLIGDATVRVPMTTWQDLADGLAEYEKSQPPGTMDG